MSYIAHQSHSDADLFRFSDGVFRGTNHREITECAVSIKHHGCRCLMNDSDIWIGVETSVFKAATISVNGCSAVTADTSQVRINKQTADECGVLVCDTCFLKASSAEVKKPFFVYVDEIFWWSDSCLSPSLVGNRFPCHKWICVGRIGLYPTRSYL